MAGFAGFVSGGNAGAAAHGGSGANGGANGGFGGTGAIAGTGGSRAGAGGSHAGAGGAHAGSGGMGARAGTGGTAGVADTVDWYVDSLHGSDGNPGTFVAPFKTLERASNVADGGDTVWLFDGTYDETTEPRFGLLGGLDCTSGAGVLFGADVQIAALQAGNAKLVIAGEHGLCLSGGQIRGLQFECGPDGHAVEVSSGEEDIQGSSFSNCGSTSNPGGRGTQAGLDVSGEARVTVESSGVADYSGTPNYIFAAVHDGASLTVSGGTVTTLDRGFLVSDDAILDLQAVNVLGQDPDERVTGSAVDILEGTPSVALRGCTISRLSIGVLLETSQAELLLDGCDISNVASAVFSLRPMPKQSHFLIQVANSHVRSAGTALMLYPLIGSVQLSVSLTSFSEVDTALLAWFGGTVSLTDVTVDNCNLGASINAYPSADSAPLDVSLRHVQVIGCQTGGISLIGDQASHFDLGTSASPGDNYLLYNNQDAAITSSNLSFNLPAPNLISAIGNTWTPNTQGTDDHGLCSVSGPGQTFDLTTASGPNFTSGAGNLGILRLAESPP